MTIYPMRIFRLALLALVLALLVSHSAAQNSISYHGGAIVPPPVKVYLIWYGNWNGGNDPIVPILKNFIDDVGDSHYAHINDAYGGILASRVFTLADSTLDQYSWGHGILNERTIYDIAITNAQQKGWPTGDPSAVFFVLTSSDLDATLSNDGVQVTHFGAPGSGMCGWHGSVKFFRTLHNPKFQSGEQNLRFGFVGNPANSPFCYPYFRAHSDFYDLYGPGDTIPHNITPPNEKLGDSMVSVLAHELMETANDPDGDAWNTGSNESADLCFQHVGPYLTKSGSNANYNLRLPASSPPASSRYYFVQQQWVWVSPDIGYCAMSTLQPPTAVYPYDGLQNVATNFPVRWNDGLDGLPPDPARPISYAIYYKHWPYGGNEPPDYTTVVAAQPCNSDSPGVCSTFVENMPDGNYRWYAVANMDLSLEKNLPPNTATSIVRSQSSPAFFTVGFQPIATILGPLQPNPVYPSDGLQGVATNFPVYWRDGLDPARSRSSWPVTYAIYFKYWPFGGNEPAGYTLSVGAQPCNPASPGICATFVQGMLGGNYRWYVVANMDVSASTGISNSILSTQSNIATFTVGQPSQTGISVVGGTYGGNCGASHSNVTGALGSACNTLGHCDYIVDYTILGDPAPGCAKDYVAEWTCNGQSLVQRATASPEAGFRKTVTLVCP